MKSLNSILHSLFFISLFLVTLMGRDVLLLANVVDHVTDESYLTDVHRAYEERIIVLDSTINLKDINEYSTDGVQVKEVVQRPFKMVKNITKTDSTSIIYTSEEWFPFMGFKYDLKPISWSEREVILFTNILFRESGSTVISKNHEIDQYFVAISAIRRFHDEKLTEVAPLIKYHKSFKRFKHLAEKTTEDCYYVRRFVGAFSMASYNVPKFKRNVKANTEAWEQCAKVVKNVLAGTIPEYVPYIPHGTFAYLKKSIDTDYWWINRVSTAWCNVATTIKDHHYYANPKFMTGVEKEHLMSNPFNPIKDFNEGLIADKRRMDSLIKVHSTSCNPR